MTSLPQKLFCIFSSELFFSFLPSSNFQSADALQTSNGDGVGRRGRRRGRRRRHHSPRLRPLSITSSTVTSLPKSNPPPTASNPSRADAKYAVGSTPTHPKPSQQRRTSQTLPSTRDVEARGFWSLPLPPFKHRFRFRFHLHLHPLKRRPDRTLLSISSHVASKLYLSRTAPRLHLCDRRHDIDAINDDALKHRLHRLSVSFRRRRR